MHWKTRWTLTAFIQRLSCCAFSLFLEDFFWNLCRTSLNLPYPFKHGYLAINQDFISTPSAHISSCIKNNCHIFLIGPFLCVIKSSVLVWYVISIWIQLLAPITSWPSFYQVIVRLKLSSSKCPCATFLYIPALIEYRLKVGLFVVFEI